MNNESIYNQAIKILEEIFKRNRTIELRNLLNLEVFKSFDYEKLIAMIKYLINKEKILIVDHKNKKFQDYIIKWNKLKILKELPRPKELSFNIIKTCITLPPFSLYGLIDLFKQEEIFLDNLYEEFKSLFDSAERNIKICSPFIEWNGFKYFKNTLLSKAHKKVKIQILGRQLNPKESNSRYSDIRKIYKTFETEGLENYLDIRNYYFLTQERKLASSIHAKFILIDEKKAYIGSGEIRENSFKKNLELGIILSGEKIKDLIIIFNKIFSQSEVLSFE